MEAEEPIPGAAYRRDTWLIILHPPASHFRCTEDDCGAVFHGKQWTFMKTSLVRHLKEAHKIVIETCENVCRSCDNFLGVRPSKHACEHGPARTPEPTPRFKHQCTTCTSSFPSHRGLRNHVKSHEVAERRSAIHTPLPAPRTRGNASTRNQPITNQRRRSDDDESGNNSDTSVASRTRSRTRASSRQPPETLPEAISPVPQSLSPIPEESQDTSGVPSDNDISFNQSAATETPPTPTEDDDPLTNCRKQFQEIAGMPNTSQEWERFLKTLDEFNKIAHEVLKIKSRPKPTDGNNNEPDVTDAAYIQRLYRNNRRRAVRLITGSTSQYCNIPVTNLTDHFTKTWRLPTSEQQTGNQNRRLHPGRSLE